MAGDSLLREFAYPMNGKLIMAFDPATIGKNFQTLINYRNKGAGKQGVGGMTKINSTAITTYTSIRNGFHFEEKSPKNISHVLVQAFNSGETAYTIRENKTGIPSTGNFESTVLYTKSVVTFNFVDGDITVANPGVISESSHGLLDGDKVQLTTTGTLPGGFSTSTDYWVVVSTVDTIQLSATFGGAGIECTSAGGGGTHTVTKVLSFTQLGRFSHAPDGQVCFCDGEKSMIWSGDEMRVARFIDYDPSGAYNYDYTHALTNSLTDSLNIATCHTVDGGINSGTKLLLHMDTNFTDATTNSNDFTAVNATIKTTTPLKFGAGYGNFDGSGDWLTRSNDTDLQLDSGIWTIDLWVYTDLSQAGCFWSHANTAITPFIFIDSDVTLGTDTITETDHGLVTNDVVRLTTSGTLPVGLALLTDYYVIRVNDHNFKLASSWDNAAAGTAVDITVASSGGNHTVTQQVQYISLEHDTDGAIHRKLINGSTTTTISTPDSVLVASTWTHIAYVESGDNYYIFVAGVLLATGSSTLRVQADSTHYIGATYNGSSTSNPYKGRLEEVRMSNVARWATSFDPETVAYGTADRHYHYVGSTRPLKGIKYYIGTANTTAGTLAVYEWTGTGWSALSVTDGTAATAGTSMAQTGSLTFSTTESSSVLKAINSVVLFWYRITIDSLDTTTTISQITLDAPLQPVRNIWDNIHRTVLNFQRVVGTVFTDFTVNVVEDKIDSNNTYTFAELDSLASTSYLVMGFIERMMGVELHFDIGNTTANTVLTVHYSATGASDDTWTAVSGLQDGTSVGGISFSRSGVITWNPPTENTEFERTVSDDNPLFYYKFQFDQTFNNDVKLYFIGGITAEKKINGHKFSFTADNALFLCSETNQRKNSALRSVTHAPDSFNGVETERFIFGDETELLAAATLYSQRGSSIFSVKCFFKNNAIWGLTGRNTENYSQYNISETDGIVAPLTLKAAKITTDKGVIPVLIWQGQDGIQIFDNVSVKTVSPDIENFWDEKESNTRKLHADYVHLSTASINYTYNEYRFCFADGTSTGALNREFAMSLSTLEFHEIDRGTGLALQTLIEVISTKGVKYEYGLIDTGYMERLENGTDFDGTDITMTFQFGDLVLHKDSLMTLTKVRYVKLITIANETTSNERTITHYGDGSTTGTDITGISPLNSGKRVAQEPISQDLGNHIFHSFKSVLITDDETYGDEPLYFAGYYKVEGEHRR